MAQKRKNRQPLTDEDLERLVMESDDEILEPSANYADEDGGWLPQSNDSESDVSDVEDDEQNTPLPPNAAPTATATASTSSKPSWTSVPNVNPQGIQFSKTRLILEAPAGTNPVDFFKLLVDDTFYELLTNEINKYAEHTFLNDELKENSRITRWKDVTVDEFRTFLGLLFHMGTVSMNRIQDYWKKDPLFNFPIFAAKMSRDRFLIILRCLHFQENPKPTDTKPQDRLYKIRPVLNYFNQKMENIYYPGQNLSLDESMVLWRGRLVFRQYIKNKRHKYGIKLYMLTEPDGLILKFAVYTGVLDDFGGTGHAANIVLYLMQEKLDVGHSLFMDNYYNSYRLALQLLDRKTLCSGTLRIDRKDLPAEIKSAKIAKGDTMALYSDGVMVGLWRDKRQVFYISTEFRNDMIRDFNRRGQEKEKPEAIVMYNKYMGGVDRQDQFMAYYPISRKCLRWYQKLGIHVLQLLLLNSYFLFKEYGSNKRMTFYEFRLHIIRYLLKLDDMPAPGPAPQPSKTHAPQSFLPIATRKGAKVKRCRVCMSKDKRKDTAYFCDACPNKPALCLKPCFSEHHEKK